MGTQRGLSLPRSQRSLFSPLFAIRPPWNERAITILASTFPRIRILNATSSIALAFTIPIPEERPAIRIGLVELRVGWCGTCECRASSVRCTMRFIELMVGHENGEGLRPGYSSIM